MDIEAYLKGKTDAELLADIEEAKADLAAASKDQHESEWHEACFAGLIVLGNEASKRGILQTVH